MLTTSDSQAPWRAPDTPAATYWADRAVPGIGDELAASRAVAVHTQRDTVIAERLVAEGLEAESRPADQVRDVSAYRAVVLGGAFYNARWHPAARRFARRHEQALHGKPVWLFSSGPARSPPSSADAPRGGHRAPSPPPRVVQASSTLISGGWCRLLCTVQCEATASSPGLRCSGTPEAETRRRISRTRAGRSVAMVNSPLTLRS